MSEYVWVYMSRNGNHHVYTGDSVGFMKARAEQDDDNRMTVEEILADDMHLEVGGSEESGHFYIDDGGDITRYEVE